MDFTASRSKSLLLFLGSAMMTGLAYWCTTVRDDWYTIGAGWAGVVMFGLGALVFGRRVLAGGIQLTIDEHGIHDRRMGVGLIPWEEITGVSVVEVQSQKFLCLAVRDEDCHIARMPLFRRALSRLNRALGYPAFWIAFQDLTPGRDAALEIITKYVDLVDRDKA